LIIHIIEKLLVSIWGNMVRFTKIFAVAIILVSGSMTGVFSAPGELEGTVINHLQEPLSGCIVSLINEAKSDTTENGVFKITGLPLSIMSRAVYKNNEAPKRNWRQAPTGWIRCPF
jgi:hypothetical protein